MLKWRPSKAPHCSSLKSFFCLEQGSELQERNFIRRPTQYIPPLLGLEGEQSHASREPAWGRHEGEVCSSSKETGGVEKGIVDPNINTSVGVAID